MTDIRSALERADQRYAQRAGHSEPLLAEHLDALTAAIHLLPATDTERTIARQQGQITALEHERDQLADTVTALQREVSAVRAELVEARARDPELTALMGQVREELSNWGSPARLKGVA